MTPSARIQELAYLHGSMRAASSAIGYSPNYLSNLLREGRISDETLPALGLRRVEAYESTWKPHHAHYEECGVQMGRACTCEALRLRAGLHGAMYLGET